MQLLLLRDVRKLGHIGDVVDVNIGYARNYLLPQRLATHPTPENLKAIESAKIAAAADRARKVREFESLAAAMADVTITIEAAANPEGTLYGSVGAKEIAAALQAQGHAVLPEHISLAAPIRTLDNRMVKLEFTDEITAQVKLWVVREGGAADVSQPGEPGPSENGQPDDRDDDEQ